MPIRMLYCPDDTTQPIEVDVYHFHQIDESLECFVTCWVVGNAYWITVPLYLVHPVKKGKKTLNG